MLQHRYRNKLVFENIGLPPGCSIPPRLYCYYGSQQGFFYKYYVVSKRRAVVDPGFERRHGRIFNLHTIRGVLQHAFPENFEN